VAKSPAGRANKASKAPKANLAKTKAGRASACARKPKKRQSKLVRFTFRGKTKTGLVPTERNVRSVKVKYTGSRAGDFRAANAGRPQPADRVWHHFHDYDPKTNTGTMYLMKISDHKVGHTGGVWMFTKATGIPYK